MDLCLLMCCHTLHKTGHSLHFVFHNFRTVLPQLVELHEHAHRDRTGYKTSCLLAPGRDMQDKQSWREMVSAWLDLVVSEISTRYHNAYKKSHPVLLLHDNWGRQPGSDYLPPGRHQS